MKRKPQGAGMGGLWWEGRNPTSSNVFIPIEIACPFFNFYGLPKLLVMKRTNLGNNNHFLVKYSHWMIYSLYLTCIHDLVLQLLLTISHTCWFKTHWQIHYDVISPKNLLNIYMDHWSLNSIISKISYIYFILIMY